MFFRAGCYTKICSRAHPVTLSITQPERQPPQGDAKLLSHHARRRPRLGDRPRGGVRSQGRWEPGLAVVTTGDPGFSRKVSSAGIPCARCHSAAPRVAAATLTQTKGRASGAAGVYSYTCHSGAVHGREDDVGGAARATPGRRQSRAQRLPLQGAHARSQRQGRWGRSARLPEEEMQRAGAREGARAGHQAARALRSLCTCATRAAGRGQSG